VKSTSLHLKPFHFLSPKALRLHLIQAQPIVQHSARSSPSQRKKKTKRNPLLSSPAKASLDNAIREECSVRLNWANKKRETSVKTIAEGKLSTLWRDDNRIVIKVSTAQLMMQRA
jgi:hypothetical protein